jgi:hypothetical protein
MSAQAFTVVNKHVGRSSKLLLKDPGNGFSASTSVKGNVTDDTNKYAWTTKVKLKSASRLILRLTCSNGIEKDKRVDDGVESGTLTIVLVNGPAIDPAPVVTYVDDDDT